MQGWQLRWRAVAKKFIGREQIETDCYGQTALKAVWFAVEVTFHAGLAMPQPFTVSQERRRPGRSNKG